MESLLENPPADNTTHMYGDADVQWPNDQERKEIIEMARQGVRLPAIAKMFDLPEEILLASCGKDIAEVALQSQKAVLSALLNMAKSEKNISATTFWLKTFGSHLLPAPPAKDSPQNSSEPNRPPVDFFVYNNDGEPNADY